MASNLDEFEDFCEYCGISNDRELDSLFAKERERAGMKLKNSVIMFVRKCEWKIFKTVIQNTLMYSDVYQLRNYDRCEDSYKHIEVSYFVIQNYLWTTDYSQTKVQINIAEQIKN